MFDSSKAAKLAGQAGETLLRNGAEEGASRNTMIGAAAILLVAMGDAAHMDEAALVETVKAAHRDLMRAMAEAAN